MQRSLPDLANQEFDVVVIGGGITGICAAWEAASRGLKVALVEQADFAHAASANCFKMVHGGIRYLQHLDLARIRESSHERRSFLRIAPHLVQPLPIVIPAYGHTTKGREVLRAGSVIYDLVTLDRNRGVSRSRRVPWARGLSREACLALFPGLPSRDLTGAVLFHDGQMRNPARLALAFLKSAIGEGATVANYAGVTGFIRHGSRIVGVRVTDELTHADLEVHGKLFINAAGGWIHRLLDKDSLGPRQSLTFSRDAALVIGRRLTGPYALAVLGATSDPDALLSRGRRHLFIAPWQGASLVGVWHAVHNAPDRTTLTEAEVCAFLDEVNAAYPALNLTLGDVVSSLTGLTLFGHNQPGAENLSYGKRSVLIDHAIDQQVDNLISVVGVRYTVARSIAERAINLVFHKLGQPLRPSRTTVTPVYGGAIKDMPGFELQAKARHGRSYGDDVVERLVTLHGTAYTEVVRLAEADPSLRTALSGSRTARMEVVHAARNEMAMTLGDVVLRRTELGSNGMPCEPALQECAALLARELGWSDARLAAEVQAVRGAFPRFVAHKADEATVA